MKKRTPEQRERNRISVAKHRAAHPEHYRVTHNKWRDSNRDKINAQRRERNALGGKASATSRAWQKANPSKIKGYNLKRMHGITLDEFDRMRSAQGGACAICREAFTRVPRVDHCHSSGRIRGLLCDHCNIGIGHLRDNPESMERAAAYVRAHQYQKLSLINAVNRK